VDAAVSLCICSVGNSGWSDCSFPPLVWYGIASSTSTIGNRQLAIANVTAMFTGIIEELGRVKSVEALGENARIVIEARTVTQDTNHGDSISVNGVCLRSMYKKIHLLPTYRARLLIDPRLEG
jgi:hypothetical protein